MALLASMVCDSIAADLSVSVYALTPKTSKSGGIFEKRKNNEWA
jgi:hypothetical protein